MFQYDKIDFVGNLPNLKILSQDVLAFKNSLTLSHEPLNELFIKRYFLNGQLHLTVENK